MNFETWFDDHHAAQRDAGAVTLNMLTGDCEASLALLLPRSPDELIAIIASLASSLSTALGKIHGGNAAAQAHLRDHLQFLAGRR